MKAVTLALWFVLSVLVPFEAWADSCSMCGGQGSVYVEPTAYEPVYPTSMVMPGDANWMKGYTTYVHMDQEPTWRALNGGWKTCPRCNGTQVEPGPPPPSSPEELARMEREWAAYMRALAGPVWTIDGEEVVVQGDFTGGLKVVATAAGQLGLTTASGQKVLAPRYDRIMETPELNLVAANGLLGVLDEGGQLRHPPRFSELRKKAEGPPAGLVPALEGGRWGFLKQGTGELVVEPRFAGLGRWHRGWWPIYDGDKWGMMNDATSRLIEPAFDEIILWDKGQVETRVGDLSGLYSRTGHELAPPIYEWLAPHPRGYWFMKDGKKGLMAYDGFIMVPAGYDQILDAMDIKVPTQPLPLVCFPVRRDGRWGLVRADNATLVVPIAFDELYPEEGNIRVVGPDGQGLIRAHDGAVLVPPEFDSFALKEDGLVRVDKDGKAGFFLDGELVIPAEYLGFRGWSVADRVAAVQTEEGWGLLGFDGNWDVEPQPLRLYVNDTTSELVIEVIEGERKQFQRRPLADLGGPQEGPLFSPEALPTLTDTVLANGATLVRGPDGTLGVSLDGSVLIPPRWDEVEAVTRYSYRVRGPDGWGVVDGLEDQLMVPPEFEAVSPAFEGNHKIWLAEREGLLGLYNHLGREILPVAYRTVDLAGVVTKGAGNHMIRLQDAEGRWGSVFIENQSIEPRIPCIYDEMIRLRSDGWMASRDGMWGVVGKEGQVVLPFLYTDYGRGDFYLARLEKGGKWGLVNVETGELRIDFEWDQLGEPAGDVYPARQGSKWGFVTLENELIVEPKCDETTLPSAGQVAVGRCRRGDRWYAVRRNGSLRRE